MNESAAPYAVPFDLGTLSERTVELRIEPAPQVRSAIAEWLGVSALERLEAQVRLSRRGDDHFQYDARYDAELVQACVVSLEPVPAHLSGEVSRDFRLSPRASKRAMPGPHAIVTLDADETEMLTGSVLDLAAPVLEELSLSLDPYPRAPGVAFEAPQAEASAAEESPFAALRRLKLDPDGKKAMPPAAKNKRD